MSVKLLTANGGQLNYATPIAKPNLTASGANQWQGIMLAWFQRSPWFESSLASFVCGYDGGTVGTYDKGAGDCQYSVSSSVNFKSLAAGSSTVEAWPTGNDSTTVGAIQRSPLGRPFYYLCIVGIVNVSATQSTPEWRMFKVYYPCVGGSSSSCFISTTSGANQSTYAAATLPKMIGQIFSTAITSQPGVEVEHMAVIRGNIPFTGTSSSAVIDTTALAAMITGGSYTGTGGTANLNSWTNFATAIGGACLDWRTLIAGDLTDVSGNGNAALTAAGTVQLACGVIAPAWNPLSVIQHMKGASYQLVASNTATNLKFAGHAKTATAIEARIIDWTTKAALAGLDWQSPIATTGSFPGDFTATLPKPPKGVLCEIEIRDKNNTSVTIRSGAPVLVCRVAYVQGQSQVQGMFGLGAAPLPANQAVVDAGGSSPMIFVMEVVDNTVANGVANPNHQGGSSAWAPMSCRQYRIMTGVSALDGSELFCGSMAAAAEWYAQMGSEPVCFINGGWNGSGLHDSATVQGWVQESLFWQGGGEAAATAWVTTHSYALNAIITNSSKLYLCTLAHTSGTFATDLAAGKWVVLTPAGGNTTNASRWYYWGDGASWPDNLAGNHSGLVTLYALAFQGEVDVVLFNWGTQDATSSGTNGGALANWVANMDAFRTYFLGTMFARSSGVKILICPFGRFNTNSSAGEQLRRKQYQKAVGDSNYDLLSFCPDCQTGGEGSPHPRTPYSTTPFTLSPWGEVADEGYERMFRHMVRGYIRAVAPTIRGEGPRPVKFWVDASDAHIAWAETGWADGLFTQSAGNATTNMQECYVSLTSAWSGSPNGADILSSTDFPGVSSRTVTAVVDPLHPTRIKLTKVDGTTWPSSGASFDVLRSEIFDTSSGWTEQDTAGSGVLVINCLNAVPYGADAYEHSRGFMIRTTGLDTGLAQSTAPAANKFGMWLSEKREPGTKSLTIQVLDGGGSVVATQSLSQVLS